MLNILEGYKLADFAAQLGCLSPSDQRSMKHAFADRAQFLGDPDFVHVPIAQIDGERTMPAWIRSASRRIKLIRPAFYGYYHFNAEKGGTTHFSVIDRFGNAVACTQSVNTRFGSKLLVPQTGIVLNNEMDDFAIHPEVRQRLRPDRQRCQLTETQKAAAQQHVADDYFTRRPPGIRRRCSGRAAHYQRRPCRRS